METENDWVFVWQGGGGIKDNKYFGLQLQKPSADT